MLCAVLGSLVRPALAEIDAIDIPLEELLKVRFVSTPKFAENPDQIPSVVSTLTSEDFRLYGWKTLGDALRTLQGFNITNDHTYGYSGVRGISQPGDYRPRLQILIDGVSINENVYASVSVDSAFPLDVGLIERIEVIRGPSASVYGGDAMFGVINIITRSGHQIGGGEASIDFGSGASRRLRASWGGQVGGTDVLVSASGFKATGSTLGFDDVNGDGSSRDLHHVGGEDGNQLFVKVRGDDWRFALIHAERNRVAPTASYDTIADDTGHIESDRYTLLDVSKDWRLNSSNTLQQRLYYGSYDYDGEFPYDYSGTLLNDTRAFNIDKARGAWWGIDNALINTSVAGHRWTLGVSYKSNFRQDQLNYDRGYGCIFDDGSTSPNACLDSKLKSHQISFLAQDEIQIGRSNLLTLGLSYDHQENQGAFWSPRLGFVRDADSLGIFKLLYGTAFRFPSVYERAYSPPSQMYGNPDLRPEKMRSLEFSWEKRFGAASSLTATLYHFQIERMVALDNVGKAQNDSRTRASGFEFEYQQRWRNGSRLRAGYSLQYAGNETRTLDNSPHQMLKANLAVPTGIPALMAGFEAQWTSSRRANFDNERVPSYTLANMNLCYAPSGKPWELALTVQNVFDHHYNDPVAIDEIQSVRRWYVPQLGRSVFLKGVIRF